MKSLLYRDTLTDFEFILKFEVEDLDGLLAIALDNGELKIEDRDTIKSWYDSGLTTAFIGDAMVFEVCDHNKPPPPNEEEDPYGLFKNND